jgi:hypothetical protein
MQAQKTNAMMQSCKGSKRMQQAEGDWARHDCGARSIETRGSIPMDAPQSALAIVGHKSNKCQAELTTVIELHQVQLRTKSW